MLGRSLTLSKLSKRERANIPYVTVFVILYRNIISILKLSNFLVMSLVKLLEV